MSESPLSSHGGGCMRTDVAETNVQPFLQQKLFLLSSVFRLSAINQNLQFVLILRLFYVLVENFMA